MPYVSSYFRRSAGGGGGGTLAGRGPTVAIYSAATGTTQLRGWRSRAVEDLQFSTGLPGGFLDASFSLRTPAPKILPVDTGQKVIISLGGRTVWWGWVEDVKRRQRGRTEELGVTCLGAWQTLSQRLIQAANYTSWYGTDRALKAELANYGTYISSDTSQIVTSGVDIGDLAKANWQITDLVKLICQAGDASGNQLLFALWEPGKNGDTLHSANIIPNPDFEAGVGTPSSWQFTGTFTWTTSIYRSATHGAQIAITTGVTASQYAPSFAGRISCSASTLYCLTLAIYFSKASGLTVTPKIYWYAAGASLIGTWTGTARTGGTVGWANYTEYATSPATTIECRLELEYVNASGTTEYIVIDDVFLAVAGTTAASDNLPRAHLWARDLTGYDYLLYTARLDSGLDIVESTRDLANAVIASYGGSNYTAFAEDGPSQTTYRRRDALVEAGDEVGATLAAALRDAYLARYKDPQDEPGSFTLTDRRTITTRHGLPVDLPLIRAGDRLCIADGPYAGRIVMVASTQWSASGLQVTPERELGTADLLARVGG